MAQPAVLPDPLKRREILYGPQTHPETLREVGERYAAEGRMHDAFDFFEKARDGEGLKKTVRWAVENGDAMILHRAEKAVPASVTEEDWRRLLGIAESKGLWMAALRAGERVKDEERARKAAEAIAAAGLCALVERYNAPEPEGKEGEEGEKKDP